ncbi:MAG: sialidase family protein [Candidatus Moraniibacteriota bacterium]
MTTISNDKIIKRLPIILVAIALLAIFVILKMKLQKNTTPPPSETSVSTELTKENGTRSRNFSNLELTIDSTEDAKGLGYSGQRKIAYDRKGNVYVAYRKKYLGLYEIFVARITGDNPPEISGTKNPIAIIDAASQRVPAIAVDSKGIVHTVWYGSDNWQENNRQIKYTASSDTGQTWSKWKNIAPVSGYTTKNLYWQEHPSLLIGPDDTLYVVWEGKDTQNNNQQIKFSKSEDGGENWSPWKNIAVSKNTQSRPSLVIDQKGNLHLFMYSSQDNPMGDIQQIEHITSLDHGDTWSAWQAISDPLFDSRHASIAVDSHDVIHVAWRAGASSTQPSQIFYSVLANGEWGNILPLPTSTHYQFFPNIGIAENDQVYITWMENALLSDFPREDPSSGSSLISFMQDGIFQDPIRLENQGKLYPNVPEKFDDTNLVPVAYLEQSELSYILKLKFLDIPK